MTNIYDRFNKVPKMASVYFLILNILINYHTIAHGYLLAREPRAADSAESTSSTDRRVGCSDILGAEDCPEDSIETQLPPKVVICLNNCAICVKQWRIGVYKGRNCANDCMRQIDKPVESMDPDCSLLKYFNSTILANV